MDAVLRERGLVKLPQAVIEEAELKVGDKLQVMYGRNYLGVFIMPTKAGVLEGRQAERVSILVNEKII